MELCQQWVWVLDVVFGGILTLGYQKLEEALKLTLQSSKKDFIRHLFIAGSFLGFVIYDVGVYHVLVLKANYPYTLCGYSGGRHLLDLIMAFTLLLILVRGLSLQAEESGGQMLVYLSIWHGSAALWHILASLEKTQHLPSLASFAPHFVFIAAYWATLLGLYWLKGRARHQTLFGCANTRLFMVLLAGLVLLISVYRSIQILKVFGSPLS